jgi:cell division protease FtsH
MVCNWGMSERLGPLSFGKESDEVFLGREMGGGRNFSEKVAEEIDAEIHRIVSGGYRKAVSILRDNRVQLESLAESLLIKETLDRTQIENLMRGVQVVTDEERKAFEDAQKKAKELKKNPPQRANLAESVDRPDVSEAPPLSALPLGT